MSGQERKAKIPAPPTPVGSGNLLSSVAPPSQLPNFITAIGNEATAQPAVVHTNSLLYLQTHVLIWAQCLQTSTLFHPSI